MSIEQALGYTFSQPRLLQLALTHRSVSSDDPERQDNERLEFLGDAVLQLVITDQLYTDFPQLSEGKMAKARAAVVSRPTLAIVAKSVDLGSWLDLSPSEERSGGREKDSILADAMEAIIGAVYIDGGLDHARQVILDLWSDRIAERARTPGIKDYKTRLQERLAQNQARPVYETEGSGPDHERRFESEVLVEGQRLGSGVGRSKKEAEQEAAKEALAAMETNPRQ